MVHAPKARHTCVLLLLLRLCDCQWGKFHWNELWSVVDVCGNVFSWATRIQRHTNLDKVIESETSKSPSGDVTMLLHDFLVTGDLKKTPSTARMS